MAGGPLREVLLLFLHFLALCKESILTAILQMLDMALREVFNVFLLCWGLKDQGALPQLLKLACAWSLSHIRLSAIPWTVASQAPLSMEFSRQKYWSGLPCPSPGDLSDPGIELGSSALQVDSLPAEQPRKPVNLICLQINKTMRTSKNKEMQHCHLWTYRKGKSVAFCLVLATHGLWIKLILFWSLGQEDPLE